MRRFGEKEDIQCVECPWCMLCVVKTSEVLIAF